MKGSNVPEKRDPLRKARPFHSNLLSPVRVSKLLPAAKSTGNVGHRQSDSQQSTKVLIKPTPKLVQAIQNLQNGSKPLQMTLVKRKAEPDEDTSAYESDSSSDSSSTAFSSHPNIKPTRQGYKHLQNKANCKAANGENSVQQKAPIDPSQSSGQTVAKISGLPGAPVWLPGKIVQVLKDEGFPTALPFKSMHRLTRYRAWLEARRRRRWRQYLKAGKVRWQLSNVLKKLRLYPESTTAALYRRRICQHHMWKGKAIRAMRKLDVIIGAINYVDDKMAEIFEAERLVYEKHLD